MVEPTVRTDPARPVRGSVALLAGILCLIAIGAAGRAVSKPVWHDEIFTIYLATRLSIAQLWAALSGGVDLNPPLYYLLVRAGWMITGSEALAARLPSLAGFLLTAGMLFIFVRRRYGSLAALAAAMTPSLTGIAIYAFEGRPYGLMLGLAGAAVTSWQARIDTRWRVVAPIACAVSLALGVLTHYYFVLLLLPLAVGEAVRTFRRGALDIPMLLAFVAGTAPLLAILPLIQAARGFSSGFWSAPETTLLIDFIQQLLLPLSLLTLPIAATIGIVRAFGWRSEDMSVHLDEVRSGFAPEEFALIAALLALPIVGFALALLVTGAFHGRYVLPAALGVALVIGSVVGAALRARRDRIAVVAVLMAALALQEAGGALALVRERPDPLGDDSAALKAADESLPIVATPALVYLPLAHYAEGSDRDRLVYLMKPEEVAAVTPTTSDRALRALSGYVQLPIDDYDTFIARHPTFYLYGRQTWLAPLLLRRGTSLELIGHFGDRALFLARTSQP